MGQGWAQGDEVDGRGASFQLCWAPGLETHVIHGRDSPLTSMGLQDFLTFALMWGW